MAHTNRKVEQVPWQSGPRVFIAIPLLCHLQKALFALLEPNCASYRKPVQSDIRQRLVRKYEARCERSFSTKREFPGTVSFTDIQPVFREDQPVSTSNSHIRLPLLLHCFHAHPISANHSLAEPVLSVHGPQAEDNLRKS